MKTRRRKYNNNDYEVKDRLSDLSDGVLRHILSFFGTKQAFQTCILSKRWKNLWKTLPTLTLTSGCFPYGKDLEKFDQFIVNILSLRDRSTALRSLDIFSVGNMHPELLKRIVKYAVSYHVQQLRIQVNSNIRKFPPCLFSCHTLMSLELIFRYCPRKILFPTSLNFPALTNLSLECISFCVDDQGCVDPFSKLNKLISLHLNDCVVNDNQQNLCISSATLVKLKIDMDYKHSYMQFHLSTPSLCTFEYSGTPLQTLCESGSIDDLSSVKHVNFHVPHSFYRYENTPLIIFDWLIELTNIESLTLTLNTVEMLSLVPDLLEIEFPSLYDLKSLKIVTNSYYTSIPEKVVNFLLRNAPSAKAASFKRLSDGMTVFTEVLLNREWNEEHSYQGKPY